MRLLHTSTQVHPFEPDGIEGAHLDADPKGVHSVACMGSGVHTTAHNEVRDTIWHLACLAQASARRELAPWAGKARPDILLWKGGKAIAVDVSIVSPFTKLALPSAVHTGGAAAERASSNKLDKYRSVLATSNVSLVPACWDAFGAWSADGLLLVKSLASPWGRRFDIHPCQAIPLTCSRLTALVMEGVGSACQQLQFRPRPASVD